MLGGWPLQQRGEVTASEASGGLAVATASEGGLSLSFLFFSFSIFFLSFLRLHPFVVLVMGINSPQRVRRGVFVISHDL